MSQLSSEAIDYIKKYKKELCEKFASPLQYLRSGKPSAYFMAGSPGAGKTEYSKAFIKSLTDKSPERKIVRIDADEIRDFLPQYDKLNSSEVQGAASLGVQKIFDHVMLNRQDFLLDGTFSNYQIAETNIKSCLKRNYDVGIIYLYQEPLLAWEFTKRREVLENRPVPKDIFIKSFFSAKENVNKIKELFGDKLEVWLIIKDFEQNIEKTYFNIKNIDNHLKTRYNLETLEKLIN